MAGHEGVGQAALESPGDLSEAADPSADVDQPVEEFGDDVLIIEASDE